jgi:hypothetical protein
VPFACDAVALSIPNRGLELDTIDDLDDRAEIREGSEPSARSLQHSSRTYRASVARAISPNPPARGHQDQDVNDPPEIDADLDPDQICSAENGAATKLSLDMD